MHSFYILFYGVLWCYVQALPADVSPNLITCSHVKPIFETKNISTRIPSQPIDGKSLTICKADKSCCTSEMETNLMNLVKKDYQSLLQQNAQSVQGILASTAIHFTEYIHQMLSKSQTKTKQKLRGVLGASSAAVDQSIEQFFYDLNQYITNKTDGENAYYQSGQTQYSYLKNVESKLGQLTSSLFSRLFPIVYPMGLSEGGHGELDDEYKRCLQSRISNINPFSDLTKMLEKDIAKTFEATKVLIDALNFGAQMLNFSNLLVLSESSFNVQQCHEALLRMSYCSRCDGHASPVKPCAGYCLNVMRGCVAQQAAEFDSAWSGFYEAVERLISMVNRGQSLVCLEDLLVSLDSRITEPVQYFKQQNGSIHTKVKFICGQVRWSSSPSENTMAGSAAKLPESNTNSRSDEEDLKFRSNLLSSKINQFQESVPRSKGFYSNLAETLCADDSFAEKRDSASCWNGQRVAEYAKTVLPIQITSQKYNPELPWTSPTTTDVRITEIVEKLRHTKQLVLSQMIMESESLSQPMSEDGSGSGIDPISSDDHLPDDEDAEQDWKEQGSGSGESPVTITDSPDGFIPKGTPINRNLPDPGTVPPETKTNKTSMANLWTSSIFLMTACNVVYCWISF